MNYDITDNFYRKLWSRRGREEHQEDSLLDIMNNL